MVEKRKPTYEQQLALDRGRAVLRAKQRAARASKERASQPKPPPPPPRDKQAEAEEEFQANLRWLQARASQEDKWRQEDEERESRSAGEDVLGFCTSCVRVRWLAEVLSEDPYVMGVCRTCDRERGAAR